MMAQCISSGVLFLVSLLIPLLLIIPKSTASPRRWTQYCPNTTMFANNSQYQTNLNAVFRSLNSEATNPTGYAQAVARNGSNDAVFSHFLCRGDLSANKCKDCVMTATTSEFPNICPNRKVAIIWYEDCMVRYSNESFFGVMSQMPWFPLQNSQNITGDQTKFMDAVGTMMNDIAVQTSSGGSKKKFGTAVAPYTSLLTIYGMGQCTPDISSSDCNNCLRIAIGLLPISIGARAIMTSCNVRYEIYPFFEGAYNATPPSPTSSPTPSMTPPGGNKKLSTKMIIAIVAPVVAVSLILLSLCFFFQKKKSKKKISPPAKNDDDLTSTESLQYDLTTLQSATNNFADENKLGEGGFGCVYEGTLSDGQKIAVKRLSKGSCQGEQEFKNEAMLVAKLQHRNLVRLLGFCVAGEEKLLVYEFISNKSLDFFLFDVEKQGELDWGLRYNVILGVARGMLYLHHDSRLKVIHRDLKASNVLLDMNMNPKISDFGMARIFPLDQTQGNTSRVVGTYGYMSPEYAMHGNFSTKSDVYSFGVLVLEIISGKRNSIFYQSGYAEDLLTYAWKLWSDETPLEFVDQTVRDSCSANDVKRCIHLGLLCVQESVDKRPTMATAVLMLDSQSVTLPTPLQPNFIKSGSSSILQNNIFSDQSNNKSMPLSVNDVSITEMEPR